MISKHAPKPDLLNYDEQLNCKSPQSSQNSDYIDNIVMQSDNDDSIPIAKVQFKKDQAINDLYKSAVEFIVSLHDNNNFTKKDVTKIQSGIIQNLLTPKVNTLKMIVKTKVKELLSLSKFNQIITAISNPFQYCSSEYNLLNWLSTNDLISEVQQFTINNEICPIQHMGESIYDEKKTKGALLPLKLQFKKYFEHGNNLKIQMNELQKLQPNNDSDISNFIQGNL